MSVSSLKFLNELTPILLVSFDNLNFHYSTKDYSISEADSSVTTYKGIFKKGTDIAFSSKTSSEISGLLGISRFSISITDYIDTIVGEIVDNGFDVVGQKASVSFIFEEDTADYTNRLLLLSGTVANFSVEQNSIIISLENDSYGSLGVLPTKLITDDFDVREKNYGYPLQYGDFNWDVDPRFYADAENGYAVCPFIESEHSVVVLGYRFQVSSHEMNTLPTAANINDSENSYMFLWRDGRLVHYAIQNTSEIYFTNTPTGATLDIPIVDDIANVPVEQVASVFIPPKKTVNGSFATTMQSPTLSYDGKKGTSARIDDRDTTVNYAGFETGFSENKVDASKPIYLWCYVKQTVAPVGVSNLATVKLRSLTDNTVVTTFNDILSSHDDEWVNLGQVSGVTAEELNNYYVEIRVITANTQVHISHICFQVFVQPFELNKDHAILLRCKGREYSGTWDGRKTAGALITNPVDVIESLLRDEISVGVDTTSFDGISNIFSNAQACLTLFKQKESSEWLDRLARSLGILMGWNTKGVFTAKMFNSSLNFTYGGNSTPSNIDRFSDNPNIYSGFFDRLYILKDSFKLKTNPNTGKTSKVTFKFVQDVNGELVRETRFGVGGEIKYTIDNYILSRRDDLQVIADLYSDWTQYQTIKAYFKTGYCAIDISIGHIVALDHFYINDRLLGETAQNAKWIVTEVKYNHSRGVIEITLSHLPSSVKTAQFPPPAIT